VHPRGGHVEPERTGVGGQGDVQALGDLGVQRHVQPGQQLLGDHRGGRRLRVDQLDAAEAGVRRVVVEDDRLAGPRQPVDQATEPGLGGHVEHDHQVRIGVRLLLRHQQIDAG
jgi:hypothetical protein